MRDLVLASRYHSRKLELGVTERDRDDFDADEAFEGSF